MPAIANLKQDVKKYLTQQAEIYGPEFYLDAPQQLDVQTKKVKPTLRKAATLRDFSAEIQDCVKCNLAASRQHLVFGAGAENADLMCIGGAPGFDDDKHGKPVSGAAGDLFDKILGAIGFKRAEVYVANIVKCMPPNGQKPSPAEIAECLPFLRKQIELVQPQVILALGLIAARALLGSSASMAELRSDMQMFDGKIHVVVTLHPSELIDDSTLKRATWGDVQKLRQLYDGVVRSKSVFAAADER